MPTVRITIVPALVAITLFTFPSSGADAVKSPKETIERWAKAFTAKDAADLLAFYDDSDDLIVISAAGHQSKGFATVKKEMEELFRKVVFSEHEVSDLSVVQHEDVAWATCKQRGRFRDRADDSVWQLEIRTTLVLKRQKNSWHIVLDHSSPIADVPRLKAIKPGEK